VASGSTENGGLRVRAVALISAFYGKWKSRARPAASLSFIESGSYEETGFVSGGFGVTLNIFSTPGWSHPEPMLNKCMVSCTQVS